MDLSVKSYNHQFSMNDCSPGFCLVNRNHNEISEPLKLYFINLTAVLLIATFFFALPERSYSQTISFEAETGNTWFSRNDVRIPNEGGTEFNMLGLIGTNGSEFYRLQANLTISDRHTIRVLAAPISRSGTGEFATPVNFEGRVFEAGVPVEGTYQFNTYRLTYRYIFFDRNNWKLGAGAAALIRDAKVELRQGGATETNTDLGFVPLIHLYAKRDLGNGISVTLDGETLAAQQGRATDAAIFAGYDFSRQWTLNIGYRVLEGGADVDEVYNFAWINFAFIGLRVDI